MCVYLHVCMCTMGMPTIHGCHKWVLDPLELELQVIGSHYMGGPCSYIRSLSVVYH